MLLGGSSNNSNVFACPRCFEKTRHIKISYQEAFSEMGNAARVIGGINDITGIGKISSLILNLTKRFFQYLLYRLFHL